MYANLRVGNIEEVTEGPRATFINRILVRVSHRISSPLTLNFSTETDTTGYCVVL